MLFVKSAVIPSRVLTSASRLNPVTLHPEHVKKWHALHKTPVFAHLRTIAIQRLKNALGAETPVHVAERASVTLLKVNVSQMIAQNHLTHASLMLLV